MLPMLSMTHYSVCQSHDDVSVTETQGHQEGWALVTSHNHVNNEIVTQPSLPMSQSKYEVHMNYCNGNFDINEQIVYYLFLINCDDTVFETHLSVHAC